MAGERDIQFCRLLPAWLVRCEFW